MAHSPGATQLPSCSGAQGLHSQEKKGDDDDDTEKWIMINNLYAFQSSPSFFLSLFPSCLLWLPDGSDGLSILPIAALSTGAIVTIAVAVLLVVVVAVRRRHEANSEPDCDGKSNKQQIGEWVTTTGTTQQFYVFSSVVPN